MVHTTSHNQSEDENENPLSHENWMKQTNWKIIKYVIHHKHSMTPQQLKKKPFKPIIKIKQHEKLHTEVISQTKMKRNLLNLQKFQIKILHLIHLLKLLKDQNLQIYIKFIMF